MNSLERLYAELSGRLDRFVAALKTLVEMESPSRDKPALDRVADHLAQEWSSAGLSVTRIANAQGGDHLRIDWPLPDDSAAKPWLVLGHFDTVWASGTLEKMPFRRDGDQLFGPGTYDMKASLAMALEVVKTMNDIGLQPSRPVRFLWTSDEEIGSSSSRQLIEANARESFAALVPEAPLAGGALKTARKGVGAYRLEVMGRAAHAGVEPEKGRSAIVELAHQILAVGEQARPELGTTLNVGKIGGGSANNVVPELAWAEIDARVAILSEAEALDGRLRSLRPITPDTTFVLSGGLNRPPMERTAGTCRLFETARAIAASLGYDLSEGATGGGSDGNFTSAAGCPTLDGLGLEGAGAHASHEHVDLTSWPFRATLLAGLLMSEPELGERR
ncbi:M20/M25/M40 family metallo-hydrolase [bacterium]|nr:M20/M25/M40 family metallo-hydrolase [bacterium]